jgi:GT2 family glycosyltransferase
MTSRTLAMPIRLMRHLLNRLSVVILTFNRSAELQRTLVRMCSLPERPEIIVVDNGSHDATRETVGQRFPKVHFIGLRHNIGAAARNVGVQMARAPYVAFCDDDTWWSPGALAHAADMLDAHPSVAVLSARVLVGDEHQEDPTCALMAESPLPAVGLPGPALIGFLAGACVMRRDAYLSVGGYEPNFFIGGEEALLGLDLVAAGWRIVYARDLTVHHYPSAIRDTNGRLHFLIRNALWLAWMRLPWPSVWYDSVRICRSYKIEIVVPALISALRGLPWVLQKRKRVPEHAALMYRMVHH